jgi:hypothetical protein
LAVGVDLRFGGHGDEFLSWVVRRSGVRERRKVGMAAGLSGRTFGEERYLLFLVKKIAGDLQFAIGILDKLLKRREI